MLRGSKLCPQELTLSLAQLSFAGAEPTSETAERLAAVAEQLLRAPERRVSIEAEFNLPDPEARTMLEQRVEIVRAILLRRGVAPERVVVRASGDGPAGAPGHLVVRRSALLSPANMDGSPARPWLDR